MRVRLLATGWCLGAAVFLAAYLLGGYEGWAAILVWGLVGGPLYIATARYGSTRGRPLPRVWRVRGLRAYAVLAASSAATGGGLHFVPADMPTLPPALGYTFALVIGLLFVGQVLYVTAATLWLTAWILDQGPPRPAGPPTGNPAA